MRRMLRRIKRNSWMVHATVDEPDEMLAAFAAHYLGLGAHTVSLYLDTPRPEQETFLRRIPGVEVTVCDSAYWARHCRKRPENHVGRQTFNASLAFKRARSDWFLFADADEYLVTDRPFRDLLAQLPDDQQFARLSMAERVFAADPPPEQIFSGRFRLPIRNRPKLVRAVYGDLTPFLDVGLTGHNLGKSVTRTRCAAHIWLHHPHPPGAPFNSPATRAARDAARFMQGARLVHYDGMTPFHLRLKLLRKMPLSREHLQDIAINNGPNRGPGRQAQIAAALESRKNADRAATLEGLHVLRADQLDRLEAAGFLINPELDPERAARALLPDRALDYSTAHFDAGLLRLYGKDIAALGLDPPKAASIESA